MQLFGYCLDIFLYGILTVQIYLYYLAFPNDQRMTKIIVYFAYVIGTLQTALALHDFYTLFCTPEGQKYLELPPGRPDPHSDLLTFGFMWFTIPVGGVLVASVAQLFYAHRIYVASKAKAVTGTVCLLTFIQLVSVIISAVSVFTASTQSPVGLAGGPSLIAGGAAGAICDLLIALYMSRYLSRQMKGTFQATQVAVTKVVRLLLETGILTAGMATAYMVLFVFMTLRFVLYWCMVPGLSLGKLYAISMLVLLNNCFTVCGGRNTRHPGVDINRRTDLEENSSP